MSLYKILIDDGEAAWDSEQGANVVCTADADHKVGTKSAKMAISAGLGAALLATQDIVAGATDYSSCRKTRLWIKSSVDVDAGDLQLLLDATADCPTPEETLDIPALTAGTWALVDIPLANPASDGAIVSVGLAQTKELGALDVYIDDCNGCEVYPEYQKRGMLGWYVGGGKWVPLKVDANGAIDIVATVADIVTAHISHWGGTELTGRDISLDLKALVDDSIKGILKSIGDAGEAENLLERIGEVQATPTANTVLDRLKAILGASTKDLTTLETELAKKVNKATTPTKYALTITNADTEYSQALPANTKQFSVHLRDMSEFRLAYETGLVAGPTGAYETVPAGSEKYVENIEPASLTLYIAAPAGTKVAEIEAWA